MPRWAGGSESPDVLVRSRPAKDSGRRASRSPFLAQSQLGTERRRENTAPQCASREWRQGGGCNSRIASAPACPCLLVTLGLDVMELDVIREQRRVALTCNATACMGVGGKEEHRVQQVLSCVRAQSWHGIASCTSIALHETLVVGTRLFEARLRTLASWFAIGSWRNASRSHDPTHAALTAHFRFASTGVCDLCKLWPHWAAV